MGKLLIIIGLIFILAGLVVTYTPGNGLPRLPGDIYINNDNQVFYFPLGWCVLLSLVASLVAWFLSGK
jgi:hypothetical protein